MLFFIWDWNTVRSYYYIRKIEHVCNLNKVLLNRTRHLSGACFVYTQKSFLTVIYLILYVVSLFFLYFIDLPAHHWTLTLKWVLTVYKFKLYIFSPDKYMPEDFTLYVCVCIYIYIIYICITKPNWKFKKYCSIETDINCL